MLKSYFWAHEQEVILTLNIVNEPIINRDNLCAGLLD